MNYGRVTKIFLKVFLGFLAVTAVVAIFAVLKGDLDETDFKIIATSLTISVASVCAMSCAAFIAKKGNFKLGALGMIFAVIAAVLLIAGLWPDIDSEPYWKVTWSFIVAAFAFAHVFLLSLPKLDINHKWVQWVTAATIIVLAGLIIHGICAEIDEDIYWRITAVAGIIVGLETLAVPIMMKLRKDETKEVEKLTLEIIEGDIYTDGQGNKYKVEQV